jgi:pilus assembly protein CpaF
VSDRNRSLRDGLAGARSRDLGRWVKGDPAGAEPEGRGAERLALQARLQRRFLDELEASGELAQDEAAVGGAVREFVKRVLEEEDLPLNVRERAQLEDDLAEEVLGTGPLAPLLSDPSVTDVLVNGPERVFIERRGRLEPTSVRFRSAEHMLRVIERIAARVGRRIDSSSPMVDLRLPDGSRVNATLPPVSPDGPTLSIRRFGRQRLRLADWLRIGSLSEEMAGLLALAVRARKNLLIAGGTGAGKSTLLGALAGAIPETERLITIEDTLELDLGRPHVVRLETRPANAEGAGRITARDLLINALRMRPDRLIVGEVRGGEALDMLQAMNTGHEGSLCTIHANSPRDALARLETMVLMAGTELPSRAIREQIASAIHLVVEVRRFEDGVRRVASVSEMVGMEETTPLMQDIFRFTVRGLASGKVQGAYRATGTIPRFVHELRRAGVEVPLAWFHAGEVAADGR